MDSFRSLTAIILRNIRQKFMALTPPIWPERMSFATNVNITNALIDTLRNGQRVVGHALLVQLFGETYVIVFGRYKPTFTENREGRWN